MPDRFDVAILGAGLFGSALAFHLAQDPALRVVLADPGADSERPSGTEASGGVLTLQGWDPWDLGLVRESTDEYERLAESEGAPPLRRNGGLRVARTEEGERWLRRLERALSTAGVPARWLGPSEAGTLLPFADLSDVRSALFTEGDSIVSSAEIRDSYLRAAELMGVERRAVDASAVPRTWEEGAWTPGDPAGWRASQVVLAAGAATKRVAVGAGVQLPLAPFRAQAVRFRPAPLVPEFPTLHDLDLDLYLRPTARGRILAGDGTGTREEDPANWNPRADDGFLETTRSRVSELCAELRGAEPERSWAGLCSATPDRFPLVGPVPGRAGLFVASGFNGFGTMRAGALAARLAEAMRTDDWNGLAPADPRRFAEARAPFDPRPEFPLEVEPSELPAAALRTPDRSAVPPKVRPAEVVYRLLAGLTEVDDLRWAPLSEWFDPFLALFAKDSLRTGGSVEVAEVDGVVRGLSLFGSSEGVGSGFTRERRIAERYLDRMGEGGVYLDAPWRTGGETVEVLGADLRDWRPGGPLRNPVRVARPSDLPQIANLLRSELGPGVDPWIATLPRPEETGFVCESAGRVVGVSWLSRAGAHARGHSFVVHPRFRGLGIGTDLLEARMLWLRRTGGESVVSEIYDGNAASRTAAERAGMAVVARMHHVRPVRGGLVGRSTSAAPRTSGTPSPSSPSTSRSSGTGP